MNWKRETWGPVEAPRGSFGQVLAHRALEQPEKILFRWLEDGVAEAERRTYGELHRRAGRLAGELRSRVGKGEAAVLLFPPGLGFIEAFFGCLYAGVMAVPALSPRPRKDPVALRAIVQDVAPSMILTTATLLERSAPLRERIPHLAEVPWLAIEKAVGPGPEREPDPEIRAEDVAFLQYTSGSTSLPKGVMVRHGNLLANEAMIQAGFGNGSDSVMVGWLPLYHDMGLIGNVLQPLYLGATCVLMSPLSFLRRPSCWLQAISKYGATVSGGPNFAYDLCVERVREEDARSLDLSSWRVAYNGAEPVRAQTMERFARTFALQGFRKEAFFPCYGLAEATLFVSGADPQAAPEVLDVSSAALEQGKISMEPGDGDRRRLVSSGRLALGTEVLICDPQSGTPCGPGEVGEILVEGPGVAGGYWQRLEATGGAFGHDPRNDGGCFLRTGDLGFLADGELYVTGRIKDLLILRGRNHYPQDLEQVAETSHPALRSACSAAFAVTVEGEERLVLVAELDRRSEEAAAEAAGAIRQAIAEEHEVQVYEVVLLRAGRLPKTSSGKVQRSACRQALAEDRLPVIYRSSVTAARPAAEALEGSSGLDRQMLLELPTEERRGALEAGLRELLREVSRELELGEPTLPLTRMGLDSLGAVEFSHQVESSLGLDLPLENLLGGSSLQDLAEDLLPRLAAGENPPPIALRSAVDPGQPFPLSRGQRALYFLERLAPESGVYNLPLVLWSEKPLHASAIERAGRSLVERHPMLRARFSERDGEPEQRVADDVGIDFGHLKPAPDAAEERRILAEQAYAPLDWENGPLLRIRVGESWDGGHLLLFVVHHLVCDFWSVTRLLDHFGTALRLPEGEPPQIEAVNYADFVAEEVNLLTSHRGERLWQYWRQRLLDEAWSLELPVDRPWPRRPSFRGDSVVGHLDHDLMRNLESLTQRSGTTLFTLFLAAWQVVLHRHSGQQRFLVGSPVLGRSHAEWREMVGYCVNPLPLRAQFEGTPNFEEVLRDLHHTVLEAFQWRDLPFASMVEQLAPKREAGRSPLFQTLLVFQQAREEHQQGLGAVSLDRDGVEVTLGGHRFETRRLGEVRLPFDLALDVAAFAGGYGTRLEYSSEIFDRTTAARLLDHFQELLVSAVRNPDLWILHLPMMSPGERWQLLGEWHSNAPDVVKLEFLHHLFEKCATAQPEAPAVLWGSEMVTYGELERRSRGLARRLRSLGVGPEVRVGICLERSARLPLALLGALRAGGVYVPLDPAYPAERLRFMLEDSGARVLVTEEAAFDSLSVDELPKGCHRLSLDAFDGSLDESPSIGLMDPGIDGENLAYVIYTSGSTGRPKGVAIRHRNAAWLMGWASWAFPGEELEGVLASTSICFDLSIFEIFVPLTVGGRVLGAQNALELPRLPYREKVRLINTVPSVMVELLHLASLPKSVAVVNLAGEALPRPLVEEIHKARPGVRILNLYGPSEDTTYSTWESLPQGEAGRPPIGRPVSGTRALVLNTELEPVAMGIPGDLYLGGESLARGYLGRTALTAERFVPDPFSDEGRRLYHTGDLVRWSRRGHLDYLGRVDHQVKLRGFRVELGEVEAVLLKHDAVKEVAAGVVQQDLVAYVVPAVTGEEPEPAELRRQLAKALPGHMVTSRFLFLDELPRLPNGKMDRRKLQDLDLQSAGWRDSAADRILPRTPVEEVLAGLWQEILEVDEVGIHEGFFDLGGHSLSATRLLARTQRTLGVDLDLVELFEHPTLADMAHRVEKLRLEETTRRLPDLVLHPREEKEAFPLSFAQERLFFLHRLEPLDPSYNMAGAAEFRGKIHPGALAAALESLVERHAPLRTVFRQGQDGVEQVERVGGVAVPEVDLTGLGSAAEAELQRLARQESLLAFDLALDLPVRFTLVRVARERSLLLLTLHHIAGDGWSLGVLLDDLSELYIAAVLGRATKLLPLEVDYLDYALWQREWLSTEALEGQLDYWREQLRELPHSLGLPTDRGRPRVRSAVGGRLRRLLPASQIHPLGELARECQATTFMALTAVFEVLLHRLSGAKVVPLGLPVAGRPLESLESLVGVFVNTLVLRGEMEEGATFRRFLNHIRRVSLEAYSHQDLPFERLVEELAPVRDTGQTPLFQVLIVHENVDRRERQLPDALLLPRRLDAATTKFDLELSVAYLEGEVAELTWTWSQQLFDTTTLERWARSFERLLLRVLEEPDRALVDLPLLAPAERHQMLLEWNPPLQEAGGVPTIQHAIEKRSQQVPDRPAVTWAGHTLSYGEMVLRARLLAGHLLTLGLRPEDRVAVCLERSARLPQTLLGVLLAGGTSVPLDPAYPESRLHFMAEDSGARIAITESTCRATLESALPAECTVVDLDEQASDEPPARIVETHPEQLAYLIYTSGSTGRPKGVAIPHSAAAALLAWAAEAFPAEELEGLLAATSVCFDLSVFELFVPLALGGRVVGVENALAFAREPERHRVRLVNTVPSAMAEVLATEPLPASVRAVCLAGEPLPRTLVDALYWNSSEVRVLNLYGPSEDTTYSTVEVVPAGEVPAIGRAVRGSVAHVLDAHFLTVPCGVPGELFLGGGKLARGYLGRPGLTAERFVPDPFGGQGTRLYSTGDLVRWTAGGSLLFLGRRDHQVKVRGFRIELGEVEAAVLEQDGVEEAVVVVPQAHAGQMVAYLVLHGDGEEDFLEDLRRILEERLPAHMVPGRFAPLHSMPHLPNGKVDRGALMRRELEVPAGAGGEPPQGATEVVLAGLWREFLAVEEVNRLDRFFALGGHSLTAGRLVARLRDELGVELPLRDVFEYPTLEGLARRVDELRSSHRPILPAVEPLQRSPDELLPLSFGQDRLFFLHRLNPADPSYNLSAAARLEGRLMMPALEQALSLVVARHEPLRTTFEERGTATVQRIHPTVEVELPEVDLSGLPRHQAEQCLERIGSSDSLRPFDLYRGPILRALLLRIAPEEHVLLLGLHHIAGDGASLRVLMDELVAFYGALAAGGSPKLAPPEVTYADFATWQRTLLEGPLLKEQLAWWTEQLANLPPVLDLPTDRPRPAVRGFRGGRLLRSLRGAAGEAFEVLAQASEATPFLIFTSLVGTLLHRLTGAPQVPLGTPVAGRPLVELEELIGFFVNTLVLPLKIGGQSSVQGLLEATRTTAIGAFAHQDLPYEKLVEEVAPERDTSRTPLFQTLVVEQNVPWQKRELPGLRLEPLRLDAAFTKFDLMWALAREDDGLRLTLTWSAELFDTSTAHHFLDRFERLLEAAALNPQRAPADLPLLGAAERHQLFIEWTPGDAAPLSMPQLGERLEAAIAARPDAMAVAAEGQMLSFGTLETRSRAVAIHLLTSGLRPEEPVGLLMERSVDQMVGLWGILRSGATLLPLSVEDPPARLAAVLEDSDARLVLTTEALAERLPEGVEALRLGAMASSLGQAELPAVGPQSAAYVLYTSGSTGRPKGVVVVHRAVASLADRLAETVYRGAAPGLRVGQNAPMAFDASVKQWIQLLAGHTVVMVPEGARRDREALLTFLERQRLDALDATPGQLKFLLLPEIVEWPVGRAPARLLVGGEEIGADLWQRLGAATDRQYWNVYGPTECTVDATVAPITAGVSASLGRALADTGVALYDRDLQALPLGAVGEIALSGIGLARGYLGRPGLTAERFVPDPAGNGERLYRTGDAGRFLKDGRLHYRGRLDHQLKVRGYRVELGEIEAVLTGLPEVAEGAVVALPGASSVRLVAFGVAPGASPKTLREAIAAALPAHMVPSSLHLLEALPLTTNAKVDRRALMALAADLEGIAADGAQVFSSPLEEAVAESWAEVLEVPRVGPGDRFFELGGHSLLAARLVARLRETLEVELPLAEVFTDGTVADMARKVEALGREQLGIGPPPLLAEEGDAPLSFAQERLWFLDRLNPGDVAYNMPGALRLEGPLEVKALRRALLWLVARHEPLRTFYDSVDGHPAVQPLPQGDLLSVIDLESLPADRRRAELARRGAAESLRPFDLEHGPVQRFTLVRLAAEEHALLFTLHHIAGDGWSLGLLVEELEHFLAGGGELPTPTVRYGDYARWQREWMRGEVLERELAWWRDHLADLPHRLELPTDRARGSVRGTAGGRRRLLIQRERLEALKRLGREHGATLFMVLTATFQALLARLSGAHTVPLGTPVAGRPLVELEELVGVFVNTVVLRGELAGVETFGALVERTRATALEAFAHQDLPFERLVEELAPDRDTGQTPLFQVMIVHGNAPRRRRQWGELEVSPLHLAAPVSKFDLDFAFAEVEEGLEGWLTWSTELFDATTALRLLERFDHWLALVAEDGGRALADLPLLTPAQIHQALVEWNEATAPELEEPLLHGLFLRRAKEIPGAMALVWGEEQRTYGELLASAEALARHLRGLGVGPEIRVGVCLERSVRLMEALLGVLLAGGVYVPLDPAYPEARLRFMLEDSGATVLLTEKACLHPVGEEVGGGVLRRVLVDGDLGKAPVVGPVLPVRGENLAYIIYTSGSTGRPKGVAIRHVAAAALMAWTLEAFDKEELSGMLAATSVCFDLSIFELFGPLSAGGTVIGVADILAFAEDPARESVRLVNTVPSALAESLGLAPLPESVRTVCLAGEALPRPLVERIAKIHPGARVLNLYGPSEDTTYSTGAVIPTGVAAAPTIGRALGGSMAQVLGPDLRPLPLGVPGELYLGGHKLARGYLNRPALTAERFLPDPLGDFGGRRYRTGDLVRWGKDGELHYLGRIDHQVKLRGFRIELGEIEALLLARDGVEEAVALVREDRLVAFVAGPGVPPADLREGLAAKLPRHMVPGHIETLDALPRLPNGKIDRGALAGRPLSGTSSQRRTYEAPRTPVEEWLAEVWQDLLGVERVGVRDGFFDLGGHSLLATRLVSRLRDALGVELPLREIFEHSDLATLASAVEARRRGDEPTVPMAPPRRLEDASDEAPLSFAQERLWFLEQLELGEAGYHLPAAFLAQGDLDRAALAGSLASLARRHGALRTIFRHTEGKPYQRRVEGLVPDLLVVSLEGLPKECRQEEMERLAHRESAQAFNLEGGPLLRVVVIELGDERRGVLFNLHHLVGDGWSLEVLFAELSTLYAAARGNRRAMLSPLSIEYSDYAAWQRGPLVEAGRFEGQLAWWREQLAGLEPLVLPTDRPRSTLTRGTAGLVRRSLGSAAGQAIEDLREVGGTRFMVLLGVFGALLRRTAGQEDFALGTPVAGRNQSAVEGLIGFFVNTLVVRLTVPDGVPISELLSGVRDRALGAIDHQDLPFAHLVDALDPNRELGRTPFFQVMFAVEIPPTLPRLGDLQLEPMVRGGLPAKFELMPTFRRLPEGWVLDLGYDRRLFDQTTAERMVRHFEILLEGLAQDPQQTLGDLPLFTVSEGHQMLHEWGLGPLATAITPGERLAELCREEPGAPALEWHGELWDRARLETRTLLLAHHLASRGVQVGDVVGVCLERGPDLLAAPLAIWRLGAIFVPLDPAYPIARLELQAEDSGLRILLTAHGLVEELAPGVERLLVDRLGAEPEAANLPGASPEAVAYRIYTSGSTGRPKAVEVEHRQLAHTLGGALATFGFGPSDVMLYSASFAFDISFFEWLAPLLGGGSVRLLAREEVLDPERFAAHLEEATLVHGVPGLLGTVVDVLRRYDRTCPGLRQVFVGGEAVPPELVAELAEIFPGASVTILYGPTEATIICAAFTVDPGRRHRPLPGHHMVGRPLPGVRLRLMDEGSHQVPMGTPGEILIGGPGVSRGYLGRPKLDAQAFPEVEGERWYRSGDLGRFLATGDLEFEGRVDHQVKIRGHRVELREIEAVLSEHAGVRRPVAVVHHGDGVGEGRLVVYYLAPEDQDAVPTASELEIYLAGRLPSHMVPSLFVELEEMPQLPTGKIDRKVLTGRALEMAAAPDPATAGPTTVTEDLLARLFQQVLNLDREVGVEESFFALGGDSIVSIQVLARAREAGIHLTPRQIFEHPTPRALAQVAGQGPESHAEQGWVEGPTGMTPAQHHFFVQDVVDPHHFNMPLFLGLRRPIRRDLAERAVEALLRHHDALRTRFENTPDGGAAAVFGGEAAARTRVAAIDFLALPAERALPAQAAAAGRLQASLNLERGPLLRFTLFLGVDGEDRFHMVIHHLVVDGVSWRLLVEDWETAYRQLEAGRSVSLPPKTTSLKRWTEGLSEHVRSGALAGELEHWSRVPDRHELTVDRPGVEATSASLVRHTSGLDEESTRALLQDVPEVYNTGPEDALLTALVRACSFLSGGLSLWLDLEGHGREELVSGVDTSRTVGWFTALYPVFLEIPAGADEGTALKEIKEQLRTIPGKGVGFGMLRHLGGEEARQLAELPSPQLSFTYLGQLDLALPRESLFTSLEEASTVRPAEHPAGPSRGLRQSPNYLLEVVARVSGGRLEVSWTYSESVYRHETIRRLAEDFEAALSGLIHHCLENDAPGFTSSDFDLLGFDDDDIQAAFDEISLD